MSKLNPLTSALVLFLPFALTACGSSDGATTGNDHKSTNLSDNHKTNVSQDQHKNDHITSTTELNTDSSSEHNLGYPSASSRFDTGSKFSPLPTTHGSTKESSSVTSNNKPTATTSINTGKEKDITQTISNKQVPTDIITHIDQDVASSSAAAKDDSEIFPEHVNLPQQVKHTTVNEVAKQPTSKTASSSSKEESSSSVITNNTESTTESTAPSDSINTENTGITESDIEHKSELHLDTSKPKINSNTNPTDSHHSGSTDNNGTIHSDHSSDTHENVNTDHHGYPAHITIRVPPKDDNDNDNDNDNVSVADTTSLHEPKIAGALYNTVVEHPDYVRFNNKYTSGITIGKQSEDNSVFLNNFRIDHKSIQDQIKSDQELHQNDNKLSFVESRIDDSATLKTTKNKNFLLFLNYYPVVHGDFIRTLSNAPTSVKTHDGSGVKVAIIDGALNPSDLNFDFFNSPKYIHYDNDTTQIFSNTIIESDKKANHGTEVGLIIAGKQSFNNFGLAPKVNLYYSQISTKPDFLNIYKAVNNIHPTVVNNSYSFSGLKNQVVDFTKIHNFYLQQASTQNYPLYVFATGNQPTILKADTQTYELDRQHFQKSPSYNLIQIVNDYKLRDMFITVTGVKIEIPSATLASYKDKVKRWNSYGYDHNEPKPRLIADKSFLTHDDIAVPCGDSMWSCMAGFNQYYVPNTLSNNDSGLVVGTSYAAPQVTAAAALVKQNFPWMTAGNLKTTLLTTAIDLGEVGVDPTYGWGLLNFSRAMRGPMQFAFGDFYADLGNDQNTYYFSNNIYGRGGLILSATNRQGMLILSGHNTYEGNTVVMGGRLVVTDQITSDLQVQSNGTAFISKAKVGNVNNNGFIIAKDTTVKGNYNQGSMATIMLEPNHPMHVTGVANLNGTIALDKLTEYVGTGAVSRFYPILTAYKIADGSHFTQQRVDAQVNYHIYYDYAHNTVLTQITRKNASHVANRLSDDDPYALNDKEAYVTGGAAIEHFLVDADSKVAVNVDTETNGAISNSYIIDNSEIKYSDTNSFLTNSQASEKDNSENISLTAVDSSNSVSNENHDTSSVSSSESTTTSTNVGTNPILAKALTVLNSSNADMRKLIYHAADTVLANSILATSDNQDLINQKFTDKVVSDFSLPAKQFQAYVAYDYGNTIWHENKSRIIGKQISNSITAGVFTHYDQYNIGLAVTTGTSNWNQGYQNTTDTHVSSNNLNVQAVAGRNFNDNLYIATELGFGNFSFTGDHSILDSTINAKYQTQQYRTGIIAGGDFTLSDSLDLGLQAGVRYTYTHLNSFSENSNNEVGKLFAFSFRPQNQQQINATLSAGLTYNFNSFGYKHELSTKVNLLQKLHGNKFKFTTTQDISVQSTFNNRTTVSLDLGYKIHISNSLSLDLNAKFSKSSSWSNKNANLAINFQF